MKPHIVIVATSVGALLAGCGRPGPDEGGPRVEVRVAPLQLPGVGYACFDLRVQNASEVVWSHGNPAWTVLGADETGGTNVGTPDGEAICSNRYGSGPGGDIAYVGPCDATSDSDRDPDNGVQNRVTVWVDGLYDAAGTRDIGGWSDPCPNGCSLEVDCAPNADSQAVFDLTILRSAGQGFFDIGVDFDDIFCSSKLDTCYGEGAGTTPIDLLFGAGPGRDWTAVFGFACTAGPGPGSTDLLYSAVEVVCGATHFPIDLRAAEGNNHITVGGRTLHFGIYRGDEQLRCDGQPCNKRFWNFALSLDDLQGFGLGQCKLQLAATATGATPFSAGLPTGTGLAWPYVTADVALTDATSRASCQRNQLGVGGSHVTTTYAGTLSGLPAPPLMCSRFGSSGGGPEPTGGTGCASVPDPGPCPAGLQTVAGDLVIDAATALSPADLQCIASVSGDLTINGITWTSLALPNLTTVGGTLTINGTALTALALPALTHAGGVVATNNPALSTCDLQALVDQLDPRPTTVALTGNLACPGPGPCPDGLRAVTGSIAIDAASALTPADLFCISSIDGSLTLDGVTWPTLALPNLATVTGPITITNTQLASLSLGALTIAGSLVITSNAGLGSVDLGALTATYSVYVAVNPSLTALDLASLQTVIAFAVTNNPSLSACALQAVVDQLTAAPSHVDLTGNIDCPPPGPCPAGLQSVTGDVVINATSTLTLADLQCITSVGGDLTIDGVSWTTLDLPNLVTVGGTLALTHASALTAVSLPALTHATGISIADNAALTTVTLAVLSSVTTLDVTRNATLDTLALPALAGVDAFQVNDNPALSTCDLEAVIAQLDAPPTTVDLTGNVDCPDPGPCPAGLQTVTGDLVIDASTVLTPADLLCIGAIEGDLTLDGVAWTTLALPNLATVGGALTITGTDLTDLDLPALASVGAFAVTDNPALSTCALQDLVAQLDAPPATVDLTGNLGDCPLPADACPAGLLDVTGTVNVGASGITLTGASTTSLTRDQLLCIRSIAGDLIVLGSSETDLVLPALETVTGIVGAGSNAALTRFELPALTRAGKLIAQTNPALARLDAPRLDAPSTPLDISITGNALLGTVGLGSLRHATNVVIRDLGAGAVPPTSALDLSRLESVSGSVFVSYSSLTSLDLSALTTAGGSVVVMANRLGALALPNLAEVTASLVVSGNILLATIDLPRVTSAGVLAIEHNADVATLRVDALVGSPSLAVRINHNALMTAAQLPSLQRVKDLLSYSNLELQTLAMPSLLSAETNFEIHDNPKLPACAVFALLNQVAAPYEYAADNKVESIAGSLVIDGTTPTPYDLRCIGQVDGDVTITSTASGSIALTTLASIGGDLVVAAPSITALTVPALATVGGDIDITGAGIGTLAFPVLTSIGGQLSLQASPGPNSLESPLLSDVDAIRIADNAHLFYVALTALAGHSALTMDVSRNPALAYFTAPTLVSVDTLQVVGNAALPTCDVRTIAERLTTSRTVIILGNRPGCADYANGVPTSPCPGGPRTVPSLTIDATHTPPADAACIASVTGALVVSGSPLRSLHLPNLASVGSLIIVDNATLTQVALPDLTQASAVQVSRNAALASVDLGALTGGAELDLEVSTNPALGALTLTDLDTVRSLHVVDNPGLSTCTLRALLPQLGVTGPGTDVVFSGNATDCAPYDGNDPCPGGRTTIGTNVFITDAASLADLACVDTITGSLIVDHATITDLALPVLRSIGASLNVTSNTSLTRVSLPALEHAAAVYISQNPALTTIDLDKLDGSWSVVNAVPALNFVVTQNPVLVTLELARLTLAENFNVSSNAQLSMCAVHAIRQQLQSFGYGNIVNNLAESGCPDTTW